MHFIDSLAIFGAKYLFIAIMALAAAFFFLQNRDKQKEIMFFCILSLPAMYIILKLVALLYFDPRPFLVGHFTPLIPHEPDNGFPSDHTLLGAAAASIVYPYSRRLSIVLWVLTVLVGISRVYTGVHHPIDILGSIAIAIIVSAIVYFLLLSKVKASKFYINLWPGRKQS